MSTLPRLASTLLHVFGTDSALIGDLEEASRAGRSRRWCWIQVVGILVFGLRRQILTQPIYTARALLVGWATLFIVFAMIDLPVVSRLRLDGYGTGQWMPFSIVALLLSYGGFALSSWTVTRFHRRAAGPLLVLHTATIVLAMALSACIVEQARTPVPHVFFPLVSVALPYQWRSGFVLVPITILLTGMLVIRKAHQPVWR